MALGVAGVRVGHWTSPSAVTGCTVVLPPEGTLGAVAVRGAAPGTREAAALGPGGKLAVCHAVLLSGGSAFGLAAADGVVRWLEERGIGYPVADGVVPIVGAAIVLDAGTFDPLQRPGPQAGRWACDSAVEDGPEEGGVGVGAGCTVAKVAGMQNAWCGGVGVAVRSAAGVNLGAIVANNALGEVYAADGTPIARARVPDDAPRYPTTAMDAFARSDREGPTDPVAHNTVIGCIVTDARLDKASAHRVADLAHSGIARSVRPAHTEFDGDAMFCLATGGVEAGVDLVAELAADAVAEAVRRAVANAVGRHGLPGVADDVR